jgi:hypothetical protein
MIAAHAVLFAAASSNRPATAALAIATSMSNAARIQDAATATPAEEK